MVSVTSGSKLDVELCAALRLCLYAVNTSEARTCKSYFLKGVSQKKGNFSLKTHLKAPQIYKVKFEL